MPVKVLVVDDSALMRKLIMNIINEDPELEVVGTAMNGKFALQKLKKLNPDVITLDIEMPQMNGIEFLKAMKKEGIKVPVIVLSSLTSKGSKITNEALENGAKDYIMKPSGSISLDIKKVAEEIRLKIKNWGKKKGYRKKSIIPTFSKKMNIEKIIKEKEEIRADFVNKFPGNPDMILIGISTGGPESLRTILPLIELDIPILIVQHMPAGFTKDFADSLNKIIPHYNVMEAKDNLKVEKSHIYIAPGDKHMGVKRSGVDYYIYLSDSLPINNHKPSVDFLFKSCIEDKILNIIAVIMTGMGKDGAFYITKLHLDGVFTIAQDEETSIVYGMPKVAKDMGGIDIVLPLIDIPKFLNNNLKKVVEI